MHLYIYLFLLSSLSSREINVTVCCHILCVIGNIAAHLNEDTKERMIGK